MPEFYTIFVRKIIFPDFRLGELPHPLRLLSLWMRLILFDR